MLMLLIVFTILLIGSIVLFVKSHDDYDISWQTIVGVTGIVLFGIGFLVVAIVWPTTYYGYKAQVNQYQAIQQTITESRKNASDIERAALTNKVIEFNSELANAKYWGNTIFADQYPKEYLELDYLK